MDKLPRKETLLPPTTAKPSTTSSEETSTVSKAKEEADIALNRDKQVETEIKTKLRQQGYESLEQGLKDIAERKVEAETILKSAQQIEASAVEIKDEAKNQKQEAIHALEILKQREENVNIRLERAIKIETSLNSKDERYTVVKQELQKLISYHQTNIKPCVKSLRAVSKSIYTWIDLLNDTQYDFSTLYNYIGRVTRVLDKYVDHVPTSIPSGIIPSEEK